MWSTQTGRSRARAPTLLGASLLVGVVSGVGAWIFREMIALAHNLAFGARISFDYDANMHTSASPLGVAVVAAPVVGAVIVVFLVSRFAPEAKGHGVPEVMKALYYEEGRIRPVVAGVKSVASAVSIGSGGSVGREGPIAQIGAAFGSTLSRVGGIRAEDARVLVACGAAGGIAATFNAPLGGLLFAVELLLLEITPRSLTAVAVAVAAAITVSRQLLGSQLAFDVSAAPSGGTAWAQLRIALLMVAFGIVLGVVAVGITGGLYAAEDWFARFPNAYLAHMAGMLAVGILAYGFLEWKGTYEVQGVGYATITDMFDPARPQFGVLLVLACGKWLAMTLTLGSGASGGVFSPSLFIGAVLGAALAQPVVVIDADADPTLFVLAGMAAVVAGTTGAVLTASVMVTELTGDFAAIVPLLVAAATASLVRHRLQPASIYTEKLARRGLWVPTGLQPRSLRAVRARDLMKTGRCSYEDRLVPADAGLVALIAALDGHGCVGVVDDHGNQVGHIERDQVDAIRRALESQP